MGSQKLTTSRTVTVIGPVLTMAVLGYQVAGTTARADSGELEEIVVTAEKRDSTVLKTPISITAIGSQQLLEQGLSRLEDVAAQTPGISMKQISPGETEYEMRGL